MIWNSSQDREVKIIIVKPYINVVDITKYIFNTVLVVEEDNSERRCP